MYGIRPELSSVLIDSVPGGGRARRKPKSRVKIRHPPKEVLNSGNFPGLIFNLDSTKMVCSLRIVLKPVLSGKDKRINPMVFSFKFHRRFVRMPGSAIPYGSERGVSDRSGG